MKRFERLAAIIILLVAAPAAAGAQDWPNWRGPNFNGSAEAVRLPVRFSATEKVRWSTPLPGPSAGTPIIWKDRVFVTSTDAGKDQLLGLCLDRKTGKILWQRVVGTGYRPAGQGTGTRIDERSNYASPSPVTDGKRVVFFYGNGDLIAFDLNGKRLWSRNIQKDYGDFCFNWTFSSSPQLFEGRLYMQVLQRDIPVSGRGREGSQSFLLALDPQSGKQLWQVPRPSGAHQESREAFSTPIPYVQKGRKEILVMGASILTGHDAATGKELWRWESWNPGYAHPSLRTVPSPVAGAGVILASAPKREPVYAVKAGGAGQLGDGALAWTSESRGPVTTDVPTPLFYRGRFYVLSDVKHALSCIQPADGKVLWTMPIPGFAMPWGSPTGADGKIYLWSVRGEVHVLDANTGSILATNPMSPDENDMRSSIAVAYNCLFIRTNTRLYCIGE